MNGLTYNNHSKTRDRVVELGKSWPKAVRGVVDRTRRWGPGADREGEVERVGS